MVRVLSFLERTDTNTLERIGRAESYIEVWIRCVLVRTVPNRQLLGELPETINNTLAIRRSGTLVAELP